jgi:hypothetical protein
MNIKTENLHNLFQQKNKPPQLSMGSLNYFGTDPNMYLNSNVLDWKWLIVIKLQWSYFSRKGIGHVIFLDILFCFAWSFLIRGKMDVKIFLAWGNENSIDIREFLQTS